MNKELILKYKAEFDHWLNGGKLQVKFVNDPWGEAPEGIFSYSTVNFVLVIDDKYAEFRKALAEGKTIQCNAKEGENDITYTAYGDTWWVDTTEFKYATRFYRIKPEEPKFKVGDWVIHNGVHKRVTKAVDGLIDSLDNQVAVIMKEESLELWKPKEGEWCWFLSNNREPVLKQFLQMCPIVPTNYISKQGLISGSVEPFIGQLPSSFLKE